MNQKIKVIFTGGTIGSLADKRSISPNENAKYLLLNEYVKRTNRGDERFDVSSPLYILSENAVLDDILRMAEEIKKAKDENYKGIIMTHGTDTLAYTSAYLGLILRKISIPVVLVSSNLILTNPQANGVDNFIAAVQLIDYGVKPNVYVAYKNPGDDFTSIHLSTRMMAPPPYSDCFYSPEGRRFAIVKDGCVIPEYTHLTKCDEQFHFSGRFNKKCLYIEPHTGLDYNVFADAKFDYVLHSLYHSGTANTRSDPQYDSKNLLLFAEKCKKKNIPLYLCNIKNREENYDSTVQMKEKGIKIFYDILPNVALAKLNIGYNLINEEQRNLFLNSNINGEILQEQLTNKKETNKE